MLSLTLSLSFSLSRSLSLFKLCLSTLSCSVYVSLLCSHSLFHTFSVILFVLSPSSFLSVPFSHFLAPLSSLPLIFSCFLSLSFSCSLTFYLFLSLFGSYLSPPATSLSLSLSLCISSLPLYVLSLAFPSMVYSWT